MQTFSQRVEVKLGMDHTIVHFEIPADEVSKLKAFYEHVFGWTIVQVGGPIEYWIIQTVPTDQKRHAPASRHKRRHVQAHSAREQTHQLLLS